MRRLAISIALGRFALISETLPIRTYTTADGLLRQAGRDECAQLAASECDED
jgi:hypothetical protein